jgi:hexosaminidase
VPGRDKSEKMRTNGQVYGPYFYTAADIREILAYAAERHIRVVPEIELPGHSKALLAAHPEFSCTGMHPRHPAIFHGVQKEVLCAGNDAAIAFLEQVLDVVCELFPDAYVHIGGDECPKDAWKKCPKCQARIKALGLKDENELQAWVTRHFTDYLAKKGRRAVGWDEVFAGSPGKDTVIQGWHIRHGNKFGLLAAEAGYPTIVSDATSTYFSLAQGVPDDPFTYLIPGGRLTLEKAYSFNPYFGMTEKARPHVIGAECCMWSECTWNLYDLEFKLYPRFCAFAETVWTAPAAPRDYADFARRMAVHRKRLIAGGVNCAPLE